MTHTRDSNHPGRTIEYICKSAHDGARYLKNYESVVAITDYTYRVLVEVSIMRASHKGLFLLVSQNQVL